jgi:hypothetical protein
MREKTDALIRETMTIGEQMYQQQPGGDGSGPDGTTPGQQTQPGGEDVIEGEVVE